MNLDTLRQAIIDADLTDAQLTQLITCSPFFPEGTNARYCFFTFCMSCSGNSCAQGCSTNNCTHGCSTTGCAQGGSVL